MNSVILMGRLARDPELKYGGQKQTAISRFSLARTADDRTWEEKRA